MNKKILIGVILSLMLAAPAMASYDVILIHGLSNWHQWTNNFRRPVLDKFGSGYVYELYTTSESPYNGYYVDGRLVRRIGTTTKGVAGRASTYTQATRTYSKVATLKSSYALGTTYSIIGHSMGGWVGRRFGYYQNSQNGTKLRRLACIGTPHRGSPCATYSRFIGLDICLGASDAIDCLKPSFCASYAESWPTCGFPSYYSYIYNWGGDYDFGENLAAPELVICSSLTGPDDDGLVNHGDETSGSCASFRSRYWETDHKEMVGSTDMATEVVATCPH